MKRREFIVDAGRLTPGTGVIPLARIVEALRRIGYAGALSVELVDPVIQKSDPAPTARTCYAGVTRFTSAPWPGQTEAASSLTRWR